MNKINSKQKTQPLDSQNENNRGEERVKQSPAGISETQERKE